MHTCCLHPPPASTGSWKDSKSNGAEVQELASTLFLVVPSHHLIPQRPGVTLSESSGNNGPAAIAHFLTAALFEVPLRQFRRYIMFQTVKRSLQHLNLSFGFRISLKAIQEPAQTQGLSFFPSFVSPLFQVQDCNYVLFKDKTNHIVDLIIEMWNSGNALMFIHYCLICL